MTGPTPRKLLQFVRARLRLGAYLRAPGDGRRRPQIPAQTLLWAILIAPLRREVSFHGVEALVRSRARRALAAFAMMIERLYRVRYARRGTHPVRPAIEFCRLLRLALGAPAAADTS